MYGPKWWKTVIPYTKWATRTFFKYKFIIQWPWKSILQNRWKTVIPYTKWATRTFFKYKFIIQSLAIGPVGLLDLTKVTFEYHKGMSWEYKKTWVNLTCMVTALINALIFKYGRFCPGPLGVKKTLLQIWPTWTSF